ncbi:MAG: iron-sulfur cluster assembly scaffold protein [Candidatus Bipolaricaulota bacterium]
MREYAEVILEHWRRPCNKGRLRAPDREAVEANPLCGDVVRLQLELEGELVQDVRYDGEGCAISQAAASLLTNRIKGKTIAQLVELGDQEFLGELGEVVATRASCALLPLRALRRALKEGP